MKIMKNLVNTAQGFGLSLITKMASSDVLDQLKPRKFVEKSLYQGSKAGYKILSKTQKAFKTNKDPHKQQLNNQEKSLFDLSYSENQQMIIDTMSKFAADILYPLVASVDQNETFPTELWQYIEELGLNFYALPEALGDVAAEKNILVILP